VATKVKCGGVRRQKNVIKRTRRSVRQRTILSFRNRETAKEGGFKGKNTRRGEDTGRQLEPNRVAKKPLGEEKTFTVIAGVRERGYFVVKGAKKRGRGT